MEYPRNKSDEMLKLIADKGGFVGVVAYTPFMPKGDESTVEDVLDGIEHVMNVVGEDQVGIGTDFTQGYGVEFFEYLRSDKGNGRSLGQAMAQRPANPKGLDGPSEYVNLTEALMKRDWSETRIRKILGENWLGFLGEVWGGQRRRAGLPGGPALPLAAADTRRRKTARPLTVGPGGLLLQFVFP